MGPLGVVEERRLSKAIVANDVVINGGIGPMRKVSSWGGALKQFPPARVIAVRRTVAAMVDGVVIMKAWDATMVEEGEEEREEGLAPT